MRDAALRDVHQSLLLRVAESIGLASTGTVECRARVEHVARRCLPSARVWERVFSALTKPEAEIDEEDKDERMRGEQAEEELVREVYEYWRGTGEVQEATLAWARWLLVRKKRGDEAMKAISGVCSGDGGALAQKWAAVIRGLEEHQEEMEKAEGLQ